MKEPKIILPDSSEAAEPYTMSGWKSRTGHFFDDERMARYDGSTHRRCERCGTPTPKMGYTICMPCRSVADKARYDAMPEAEWDGKAMLYSETTERFYADLDGAEDDLGNGGTLADLRLVICVPVYARPLDDEYYSDDLPEDGELPEEVHEAMAVYNVAVRDIILSWKPGKTRLADSGVR